MTPPFGTHPGDMTADESPPLSQINWHPSSRPSHRGTSHNPSEQFHNPFTPLSAAPNLMSYPPLDIPGTNAYQQPPHQQHDPRNVYTLVPSQHRATDAHHRTGGHDHPQLSDMNMDTSMMGSYGTSHLTEPAKPFATGGHGVSKRSTVYTLDELYEACTREGLQFTFSESGKTPYCFKPQLEERATTVPAEIIGIGLGADRVCAYCLAGVLAAYAWYVTQKREKREEATGQLELSSKEKRKMKLMKEGFHKVLKEHKEAEKQDRQTLQHQIANLQEQLAEVIHGFRRSGQNSANEIHHSLRQPVPGGAMLEPQDRNHQGDQNEFDTSPYHFHDDGNALSTETRLAPPRALPSATLPSLAQGQKLKQKQSGAKLTKPRPGKR